MALDKLHPVQEKLIDLLEKNIDSPLTIRELQEIIGASSTSVVAHHIGQLEKKGYLKRNQNNPRDYTVIGLKPENPIAYINMYGLAQCGPNGSLLDGNPEDRIPISSRLINFPISDAFMVKAKGDSMEPKIHEGDILIAQKASNVLSGMTYVCVNDGKTIIKKVIIDSNKVVLLSYNDKYSPFLASQDFRVEGVVRGVFSTLNA